jgi:DNA polymerase III subunit epsilon
MKFVAIDVETANPRMTSICQIGLVTFHDGVEVEAESKLIEPGDYFDGMNVSIHGIDADMVRGAPRFAEVHAWLRERLDGTIAACHTPFDRLAIGQSCAKATLIEPSCQWLDTARVARRAWEEVRQEGYALKKLAARFDLSLQHHDAMSDARVAGQILLKAIEETDTDLAGWLKRSRQRITMPTGSDIRRTGDGDGMLVGETIVFTGSLAVPRRQAADIAHVAGAAVEPGVTKKTTILVVGDQDLDRLAGHKKSTKHRKAEEKIAKGQSIRILGERDFLKACEESEMAD